MTRNKPFFALHFKVLLIVLVAIGPSRILGQSPSSSQPSSHKASGVSGTDSRQTGGARRSARPRAAIDQLKCEVEALHALVSEQQRVIVEVQKRLEAMQPPDSVAAVLPASSHIVREIPDLIAVAPPSAAPLPASSIEGKGLEADVVANAGSATAGTGAASGTGGTVSRKQDQSGLLAGWGDDHAFIRNASGTFETDFTGYSQLDFRGYGSGNHPPNTFIVRRARMAMEGRIDRYFDWRIEGDFADTSNTLLRDFYVNIHRINAFVLRFGQTREPYSQEEMRSDNLQEFVERSLVNDLVPSRSPGVMAYGSFGDGIADYQIGVFNGKGLLAKNNNGTPDTALRVRFNPWKRSESLWIKGLIVGAAIDEGRNLNGQSIRGITEGQITFFQPESVNGRVYRANGEVSWLLGPATLRAEYDQSNQLRENLGPHGTNLPGVLAKGYMAQFTYLLTGEHKPDIGYVVPKHPLFDRESNGKTGLGAWELKFRYDNLQIIDGTRNSNRADSFYFGPNWYMNRWVRYVLDIGIERFKNPATAPRPGHNFFTVLTQIQLQL